MMAVKSDIGTKKHASSGKDNKKIGDMDGNEKNSNTRDNTGVDRNIVV